MTLKKTFLKLVCCIVMAICITINGVACGSTRPGRQSDEVVNQEKSQLNIGSWNGDFHLTWLQELAKRFEEEYADYSFEEGKKGVQVWVNAGGYVYDSIASNVLNDTNDIIVTEQNNYYSFVNANDALDITDALTTPLTEYNESKSVVDKMNDDYWDYYGVGNSADRKDRKYYGVPWYETYCGFSYDIAYFEEENLYFAAEGEGRNGFVINEKTPKSNGPDGIKGTADDGLPATYEEFFKLLDRMYDLGMEPIAWGGNAQVYYNNLLAALATDYEGYDSMKTNYSFSGNTKIVSKINDDGSIDLENLEVSERNGYKLKQQAGLYYGLQLIEKILTTKDSEGQYKYYDPTHSTSSTFTHRAVQANFLRGGFTDEVKTRIGILMDSTWWYSGAEEIFKTMSTLQGGSSTERRFGFMPIPKVDADHFGEATYLNNWMTNIFARANVSTSQIPLIKQFMRFMHTDRSLSSFTRLTSSVRPFEYELTAEDEPLTSEFGKQNINIHRNAKVVNPWSTNKLMMDKYSDFTTNDTMYTTIISGSSYNLISNAIRGGRTARQYFEGFRTQYSESNWNNNYSKYFN